MHLRPRCCEWLPLATQQLRLRNLARIQGLNIKCTLVDNGDGECNTEEQQQELLVYYTLHADKASKAFYTSEALPQRHQQQKWAEICAGDEVWQKSNAQCVCVKVWAHYQPTTTQKPQEPNETERTAKPTQGCVLHFIKEEKESDRIYEQLHCCSFLASENELPHFYILL